MLAAQCHRARIVTCPRASLKAERIGERVGSYGARPWLERSSGRSEQEREAPPLDAKRSHLSAWPLGSTREQAPASAGDDSEHDSGGEPKYEQGENTASEQDGGERSV